jgi:ABC-2 type transport system ATP-binding protein
MKPLEIKQVNKTFKNPKGETMVAVNDVSLTIEPGKIYGLLGPNGAGKSTLINMISGVLTPDAGTITIFGVDVVKEPEKAKFLLGVVPQEIVVEMAFTVEEVLYYFAGMYGVSRNDRRQRTLEILRDLSLEDKMHERARTLSGGMKRRLMIAKAIMHQPKLLILDEPTAGVDVGLRQKIWELVRRLNEAGTAILFTTHYLEEAEQLCENITLMNHGRVIKSGRTKDIQQEFSKNSIHFELFDRSVAPLSGVVAVGSEYEYPLTNLGVDMAKLTAHYQGNLKSVRSEAASLEQIFLKLTQE